MNRNLIVISAPSGAGKSTVCREIQRRRPEWMFSVSCTTRSKRNYEKDGVDYTFVSLEDFQKKIKNGEFFEYEEVHGNYYGTLKHAIEEALETNQILLLDVDVKGALSIKNAYPDQTRTIFIKVPNKDELIRRLKRRGTESQERIEKRLKRMELELSFECKFDISIENIFVDETVERVIEYIEKNRKGLSNGS